MTTSYSERDGIVRLVMSKEDYSTLEAIMAAGFIGLQARGVKCALRALECIARVTEGDPAREKTWPDIAKAVDEARARVRMLEVLEEIAQVALAEEETTGAKPN